MTEAYPTPERLRDGGHVRMIEAERVRTGMAPASYLKMLDRRYRGVGLYTIAEDFSAIVHLGEEPSDTKLSRMSMALGRAMACRIIRSALPSVLYSPVLRSGVDLSGLVEQEALYIVFKTMLEEAKCETESFADAKEGLERWLSYGKSADVDLARIGFGQMMVLARKQFEGAPSLGELAMYADSEMLDWDKALWELGS